MTKTRGRGRPTGSKNGDGAAQANDFTAWPDGKGWCARIGRQSGVKRGAEISILTPCLATIVGGKPIIVGRGVVRKHGKTIAVTP